MAAVPGRRPQRVLALAAALCASAAAAPAVAQEGQGPELTVGVPVGAGVLTIDPDRLFTGSRMGRRMTEELEAALRELAAENRRIEAALTAEERALTERRASLAPEEFRALAEEFDRRVEEIRRSQDAKSRALNRRRDEDRQRFLEAALPVLAQLLGEAGASVVLDRRAVFLSFDEIDITDRAIERLDEALGGPP
ncbi:MAG: OmpH family outer membrane protein [Rhodobacteraceae bacterium]|jgi:Skp family chaperone for outer membrane proteins|nr:OmpH family outer membrane protein [Paracoccaceae bacterium]